MFGMYWNDLEIRKMYKPCGADMHSGGVGAGGKNPASRLGRVSQLIRLMNTNAARRSWNSAIRKIDKHLMQYLNDLAKVDPVPFFKS